MIFSEETVPVCGIAGESPSMPTSSTMRRHSQMRCNVLGGLRYLTKHKYLNLHMIGSRSIESGLMLKGHISSLSNNVAGAAISSGASRICEYYVFALRQIII
jgi:hypothetical protein